jgi:hypothetical protein
MGWTQSSQRRGDICSVTEIRSWRSRATQCNEAAAQSQLVVRTDSPPKSWVLVLEARRSVNAPTVSGCRRVVRVVLAQQRAQAVLHLPTTA